MSRKSSDCVQNETRAMAICLTGDGEMLVGSHKSLEIEIWEHGTFPARWRRPNFRKSHENADPLFRSTGRTLDRVCHFPESRRDLAAEPFPADFGVVASPLADLVKHS